MTDLELPNWIIAFGEEALGERVNVYHKMKTLSLIFDAMDDEERDWLRSTSFGNLLDFPNKPAWSASFGLFLLSRQLEVAKPHEIWVVFAGTPIRFSLREFKIVTGLNCGRFPNMQKRKRKGTAGKKIPYYSTLFGLEEDVTVDRVISMLKKRHVTDKKIRKRFACLAIVDGFLVPTSHYPKVVKEHAEMCEDLQFFVGYPWGRLSFEMMMKSIKDRDVVQLGTMCVAVQGLLYALQLVILQAAPAIQEGSPAEEPNCSDSEEEPAADVGNRSSVTLKISNAKRLDGNCEILVDPVIFPDLEMDPAEDLTWDDECEDVAVDNILSLVESGFLFNNDMFTGGCIPSQLELAPKKQKRGVLAKITRSRKGQKPPLNHASKLKVPTSAASESSRLTGTCNLATLSRMLDTKFGTLEDRIFKRVTEWITTNGLGANHKNQEGSDSESSADERTNSPHQTSPVRGSNLPSIPEDTDQMDVDHTPTDPVDTAVADILLHYPPNLSEGTGGGAEQLEPAGSPKGSSSGFGELGGDVDPRVGINSDTVDKLPLVGEVEEDNICPVRATGGSAEPLADAGSNKECAVANSGEVAQGNIGPINDIVKFVSFSHSGPMHDEAVEILPYTVVVVDQGGVGIIETRSFVQDPLPLGEVVPELDGPFVNTDVGGVKDLENTMPDTEAKDTVLQESVQLFQSLLSQACMTPPHPKIITPAVPKDKKLAGAIPGRRSKRMRMFSTKLDGRFQYDKKTKVLVGHPSPVDQNIGMSPEERFQNSMKKLKSARTISLCGEVSLSSKDVLDLIERKKHLSAKFTKFSKVSDHKDFKFPSELVGQILGVGETGRAKLFMEADFLYVPFNFDKKHWLSLCIDLHNGVIVVLDCNTQLRKDQEIISELQPIAFMLPYLLSQAGVFQPPRGPFEIARPSCIPQVQSPLDSGIMAVFLIHAHATRGLEECSEVNVEQLDCEIKILVSAIILAGVP
ncbi:uncharacterized protein LOC17874539 [Capsella rubella]|uniref:uncharacterized protein LOC17874539 n=1 Tax=Capsella rubella TaxID=81985 RepID=UPI000CD534DD|nr:uncharacterized protein LOC17874539 [Capsella rubella]